MLIVTGWTAIGAGPEAPKSHTLYWRYIQDQFKAEALRQEALKAGETPTALREYTFDAFQALEGEGLLHAATMAIRETESKYKDLDEAERRSHVQANIALCLEYFPITAKQTDDYRLLVDAAVRLKTHPELRTYLFEQINQNPAERSLLGAYLSDSEMQRNAELKAELRKVCLRTLDEEQPQLAALRAWYRVSYDEYRSKFDSANEVVTLNQQRDTPLLPSDIVAGVQSPLTRRSGAVLDRLASDCKEVASAAIELLKLSRSRSPEFVAGVEEIIERVFREVPINSVDELRGRIDDIKKRLET